MKIFYKTRATATGGRSGTTSLDDGSLSIELAMPGSGKSGANPEQLFALGYAACFDNALKHLAGLQKLPLASSQTSAEVGMGQTPEGGYQLDIDLHVTLEERGLATMGPLKIISDGSLGTRTAHCCSPYLGSPDPTRPSGVQNESPQRLRRLLGAAHEAGLQVALHAIGDRANRVAIDAFAATGAILLQIATGVPLGVASLIGVLMLIGIVVTNAIVLVDLVNQYREKGLSAHDATIAGGSRRLRPILMTALATIFALTPIALGITGHGGFISQPLAIVVIGGLISSTVLTLLVLPTLYNLVEGARERRAARRGRAENPDPTPVDTSDLHPRRARRAGADDIS